MCRYSRKVDHLHLNVSNTLVRCFDPPLEQVKQMAVSCHTLFVQLTITDEHTQVSDDYLDLCTGEDRTTLASPPTRTMMPETFFSALAVKNGYMHR